MNAEIVEAISLNEGDVIFENGHTYKITSIRVEGMYVLFETDRRFPLPTQHDKNFLPLAVKRLAASEGHAVQLFRTHGGIG